MSWRNQPAGGNRGTFGSTGNGQSNKSSGAGGRRGSIGPRAVVLPSLRTSTGESASPPISAIPIRPAIASPTPSSTNLSSSFKDDYAMLADHAWVDEEGEMDYSFVPFSDDQQTLSVTASIVGSSVGLSDVHAGTGPSDVEDPVIKALRQRQQEEAERKREQEFDEQRRQESIARQQEREAKPTVVHPVDVRPLEVKPADVEKPVEDYRNKQQARLEEYKRIEEERKERRRLYEERNQSFSPAKPAVTAAAPSAMSWRETAKPVFAGPPPPKPEPEPAPVRIAQRPSGEVSALDSLVDITTSQQISSSTVQVKDHPIPIAVDDSVAVKERTLVVRLEAGRAPVKLRFAPSTLAELKAAVALPESRYKLDLTRQISTSALE